MGSRIERPVEVPVLPAGLPLLERLEPAGAPADRVLRLPFDARSRSRLRARLEDGTEVGLVLPRGSVLRHGAVVSGAGLRVRIEAAQEDVLEVRCPSPLALLRAAYHLGNRHVPVQVEPERLLLGYDAVLSDMLVGLGASVRRTWAPFEPEAGAYGGHAHG
jgi:urease accessory protein